MYYFDCINLSDRESFEKNILIMTEHVDNFQFAEITTAIKPASDEITVPFFIFSLILCIHAEVSCAII